MLLLMKLDVLIATKLQALYQRLTDIFVKYCANDSVNIRYEKFIKNLGLEKDNQDFQLDMDFLLPQYQNWDYEKGYKFVIKNIIGRLP